MTDGFMTALIVIGVIINAVSLALFAKGSQKNGMIAVISGWLICFAIFIINWVTGGNPPFANMYHVLLILPLVILPILLYIGKTEPEFKWMNWAFPLLSSVSLIGTLFMDRTLNWSLNPALDSPFFLPHVLVYCISYAMCALAFIMGIAYFINSEKSSRYLDAAHEFVRIGVPFMTLGMCLGALWAEQAWGIYWSWDAKETFSLVTWLVYLGFLHLMRMKHSKTLANIIQMLGFVALLVTFIGTNYLESVHAY